MALPSFGAWECFRGDGFVRKLVVKESGVLVNITGWTFTFIAKESIDDPDADAVIEKELVLTAPTNGEATLTLTGDDTLLTAATYPFAIRIVKTGGEPPKSISGLLVITSGAFQEGV